MDCNKINIFVFLLFTNFLYSYSLECGDEAKNFFVLYTRENPLDGQFFDLDNIDKLATTNFNASKSSKILVHGWLDSYKKDFSILVKNAYLIEYDANVIVVDWSKYAKSIWYNYSRGKVSEVGKDVADLIDHLVSKLGSNPDKIHIVGHSLGAHIGGIAGLMTKTKIGRVTGLDPAGPLFSYFDHFLLKTSSAKFVDVIHTDAYSAGFSGNLGHADFWPNGGTAIQPGCGLDFGTSKSHQRAFYYFAESITSPGGFIAKSCQHWRDFVKNRCPEDGMIAEMGEHVSEKARGSFYLRTNSQSPFAMGESSIHP